MTDFMNNIKSGKPNNFSTNSTAFIPNSDTNLLNKNLNAQKADVVNLSKNKVFNKNKKKKIITYTAIGTGVILAILAFFKRKQISDFFSNLFKKKPNNPSLQPDAPRPPRGADVPPSSGGSGGATPPTPPSKGNLSDMFSHTLLPTADEYTKIENEWFEAVNTNSKDSQIQELGHKMSAMKKAMIEGNISFIPKAPETFASEADKIEYIQMALRKANINEASAMDAMAVFEKYGSRYEYGTYKALNTNNGVSDLALAVEQVADDLDAKTADKVMNKYIDLFNKYARIDGDYTDARRLTRLIERNHDKMSEETVIKFIESLKQFSFERAQTWSIRKYIVENEFTKRSPEELKRIDVKLKELEEIVKDMPMKNKLKPNG